MRVAGQVISLTQFLELPDTESASNYINGLIVPRPAPRLRHSRIQRGLSAEIGRWAGRLGAGEALLELRCTFLGRSLVFDVAYFRSDRIAYDPDDTVMNDVFLAPDLTIEIL